MVCATLSVTFGAIAFGIFPPVFGLVGLVLGIIGLVGDYSDRTKSRASFGIIISIIGTVVGMLIGAAIWS